MAAVAVGPRYRQSWNPATNYTYSEPAVSLRTGIKMSPDAAMGQHRGHNDLAEFSTRPRLPSISNFLQGAGAAQPNINHQPGHPNLQPTSTTFPANLPPVRPISSSATNQSPWSSKDDMRQKLQIDQRPPYHARSASDSQYDVSEYRNRAHVVLNQTLATDVHPPHFVDQPFMTQPPHTASKRVLREDVIPGKGLCYVYDDGSICQKTINGDPVNPKWGTTKAGKPRKRLGQACNTCREKKIKCDPSYPKCTQCQKFNRECKFDPTSRSSQRSPRLRSAVTSPSDTHQADELASYRRLSGSHTDISIQSEPGISRSPQRFYHDDERSPLSYRPMPMAHTDPTTPPKRPCPVESALEEVFHSNKRASDRPFTDSLPSREHYSLNRDPYTVNKGVVQTYLDTYFSHSVALKHQLVPQSLFMQWLVHDSNKCPASILVIYAMLAWGCVFEANSESTKYSHIFAEIALEGVMQPAEHFTLPLIQARVIFCLHQFQVGHFERAWDLCGAALRAACALRLNTEDGILARCRDGPAVYGLDPLRLAESLRRTFWSIFQLDRFGVSCLGYGTPFHKANICLRLPCGDSAFASGHIAQCPLYDGDEGIVETANDNKDAPNWTLVRRMQVAALLCDVQSLASRSKLQVITNQAERVALKRRNLEQELCKWNAEYSALLYASDNQPTTSDVPRFGGLHILFHHACMVLHRHIHHAHLTSNETAHHIKSAHHHAIRTLEIAQQLVSHGNKHIYDYHIAADDPTTGYAILTAIDIVTAAGLNSDILEDQSRLMSLIVPGIELIDRIARSWASARQQQELVSNRIQFLLNSARSGVASGKVAFFITEPITDSHGQDNDVVYGGDRLRYLNALGLGSGLDHHSDLLRVTMQDGRRT